MTFIGSFLFIRNTVRMMREKKDHSIVVLYDDLSKLVQHYVVKGNADFSSDDALFKIAKRFFGQDEVLSYIEAIVPMMQAIIVKFGAKIMSNDDVVDADISQRVFETIRIYRNDSPNTKLGTSELKIEDIPLGYIQKIYHMMNIAFSIIPSEPIKEDAQLERLKEMCCAVYSAIMHVAQEAGVTKQDLKQCKEIAITMIRFGIGHYIMNANIDVENDANNGVAYHGTASDSYDKSNISNFLVVKKSLDAYANRTVSKVGFGLSVAVTMITSAMATVMLLNVLKADSSKVSIITGAVFAAVAVLALSSTIYFGYKSFKSEDVDHSMKNKLFSENTASIGGSDTDKFRSLIGIKTMHTAEDMVEALAKDVKHGSKQR